MPIIRIRGLKQEGVNFLLNIFTNIEGGLKANENQSINQLVKNKFLLNSRKSIGCLYQ